MLSTELSVLLDKTIAKEKASADELKALKSTDKPDLIEGDIFTSLYESYTSYRVGKSKVDGHKATVSVRFFNKLYDNTTWKDAVELVSEKGVWKIDDVHYRGKAAAGKSTKEVLLRFLTPIKLKGDDADAHGCKGSAGYQWSTIKNDCIRVFELPLKLTSADKTTMAGVIFSADKKQAEVFTKDGTWILTGKSETVYENAAPAGGLFLEKKSNRWEIGALKGRKTTYTQDEK